MSFTDAPSSVHGVFALDVVTAALALVVCITSVFLASSKETYRSRKGSRSRRGTSPKGTFAFLIPGVLFLSVAYALTSASVVLAYDDDQAIAITKAYSYLYSDSADLSSTSTMTMVGLSFANAFCTMFSAILLTGAVWLHSSHVTSNGTDIGKPSTLSYIWNVFMLVVMSGTGLVSWGRALSVRASGENYPTALDDDVTSRALYITFRCCVIVASISVSVEAIKRYRQVSANGVPGNSERPILARLAFYGVPLWMVRNAFIILDIVLFYVSTDGWANTTREAVAVLLIIFIQLVDLGLFILVGAGAWSMGRISKSGHA